MVLTWRPLALALLEVPLVVWLGTWWGWLVAAGVVVAVVVLDVVLAPSPRRLVVRRGGDTSIRLGQSAEVWVSVASQARSTARCRVRDAWVPSAGATGGVTSVVLPPGQRRRSTTVLQPTRRGDRRAGPVTVRVLGPLGFAGRQADHEVPWSVRVLPPFTSRKHLPSRLNRLRELDGRTTLLQRGQGTEFDSLREYVPGDDIRSIDWRGTARSSTVVVRTWRPERDRHVLVVIDSGRASAGRVGDQPRLDLAMDATLLLAALASRAGDRVDLLVADRQVRASVQRKGPSELLSALVQAMAPIEPFLIETHHRTLATEIGSRVGQRSLVVILTALDHAAVTEGLLPSLAPLLRRHRVVVAAVSDPGSEELLAGHDTPAEAYAAAAAAVEAGRRESTARALRQAGLTVVQSPPARFAPDLADHYLALRRAGRV
ncbi:DUF58 domain-containing protein [Auraticoccus monumenti]|uniref:Uncharacterized conserved protein, DUF58 family, contains vWF domain n=1 Tax=Auraticoccus monumenti TaxID=675864 RepID=A0A1G7E4D5_9ACTN|nr:DUF58 domain-containing protein [Auraticoccus monumenti]SDE58205.1 Uncharacterized conserved protein, DUF58 family, contains vWF domain [Auraticoccus monumenti]